MLQTAKKEEMKPEAAISHESPFAKVMEIGTRDNVVNFFKNRADDEEDALERLGMVEPHEAEVAPEATTKIEEANQAAKEKMKQVTAKALAEVQILVGNSTVASQEVVPSPSPVVEQTVETLKETDETKQRLSAAEVMMALNRTELTDFCVEHSIPFDTSTLAIKADAFNALTKPERMYLQLLQKKHSEGVASKNYAERLLEMDSLPEDDPRRNILKVEADALAGIALIEKTGAETMERNYLNLAEIVALTAATSETGSSFGGAEFEAPVAASAGGEKKPPTFLSARGQGSLYEGGGAPGGGQTKIEAYQPPAGGEPPKKKELVGATVKGWLKDLTFGKWGGGGKE